MVGLEVWDLIVGPELLEVVVPLDVVEACDEHCAELEGSSRTGQRKAEGRLEGKAGHTRSMDSCNCVRMSDILKVGARRLAVLSVMIDLDAWNDQFTGPRPSERIVGCRTPGPTA